MITLPCHCGRWLRSSVAIGFAAAVSGSAVQAHENHAEPRPPSPLTAQAIVAGASVPELALLLGQHDAGELELALETVNFRFSQPGSGATAPGRGYARLDLDGHERGRLAGTPARLPRLGAGVHQITATLVADDGRVYVANGRPVSARIVTRIAPVQRSYAATTVQRFAVAIAAGKVAPDTLRVTQGGIIRLDLSSDVALELHLHGYDIAAQVAPEAPVSLQFEAVTAGRFPVAAHGGAASAEHGHHALFYLEVYPD